MNRLRQGGPREVLGYERMTEAWFGVRLGFKYVSNFKGKKLRFLKELLFKGTY
jgi:hypothetical protein